MEANPALMQRRNQLVEHPVGTLKPWHEQGSCLLKGLAKVRAEFSWSPLAYHLSRVVTILGVPSMVRALA